MNWKSREITDEYQIFYTKISEKLFVLGIIWVAIFVSFFGLHLANDSTLVKLGIGIALAPLVFFLLHHFYLGVILTLR